jgi:hypothetical protein
MSNYRSILLICSFIGLSFLVNAQTTIQPRQNDYTFNGVLYNEETSFLGGIHSSGFNIGYRKGIIKKYYLTTYYHIDLGGLKHPKEYQQTLRAQSALHNITSANSFIYGKQNSFFALRGGLGAKRYFSEKARRKGVAVALTYEGGPSIGLLKPYYLDLRKFNDDQYFIQPTKYSAKIKEEFLNLNNIAGSSSLLKGITEMDIIPGIQGKVMLNFSFGDVESSVKSLEAGLMLDIYTRKIPIMIEEPNTAYFINFYVGVEFGKRK